MLPNKGEDESTRKDGVNIGIDESRNGEPYEIYVAVFSKGPLESASQKKGKDNGRENICDITDEDWFEYIILPRVEKDILLEYRSKLACISSFVMSNLRHGRTIDTLVVDGETTHSFEEDLYKTIKTMAYPERSRDFLMPEYIVYEPRADVNYEIVNKADRVAYQLKLYHERNIGQIKDRWVDYKLNPDWGLFKQVFNSIDIIDG